MSILQKIPDGYLAVRNGQPTAQILRCPEELKADFGNVLKLQPINPPQHMIDRVRREEAQAMGRPPQAAAGGVVRLDGATPEGRKAILDKLKSGGAPQEVIELLTMLDELQGMQA